MKTMSPGSHHASALYLAFFERAPSGAALIDEAGRLRDVNPALCVLLGRTRDDLLARSLGEVLADAGDEPAAALVGPPAERRWLRADGTALVARVAASVVEDADGARCIVAFVDDLGAQRAAERALRESVDAFRVLVESASDGIVVYDAAEAGTVRYANPAAVRMLGFPDAGAFVGRTVFDIIPADDRDNARRVVVAAIRASRATAPREQRLLRADGGEFVAECVEIPVLHRARPSVLAFSRDLTARRAAQARFVQADRLRALSSLVAGIAHELNSPLAGVIGNLDVALELLPAGSRAPSWVGEVAEALLDAREGSESLSRVLRRLRILALDHDDLDAAVDLRAVIHAIVPVIAAPVADRVSIELALDDAPPARGNEPLFAQLVMNLLRHAVEAIPAERQGSVVIALAREGAGVRLTVTDTGEPLPPDTLHRVFDPYFVGRDDTGAGLGLPIVHAIVTAVGGRIEVSAPPGGGTRVCVVLPAA